MQTVENLQGENSDKDFAYAIVGFGLHEYFRNAIDSVIRCNLKAYVFVVSTGGFTGSEWENFVNEYSWHEKLRFHSTPHSDLGKCGSLYDGYNLAIKEARLCRVKYLNIIRNDMQLLCWDSEIAILYEELFERNPDACMVLTGFFRKGSHPNAYNSENWLKSHFISKVIGSAYYYKSTTTGTCDWGIISLDRFRNFGVSFINSEGESGKFAFEMGLRLITSPIPCVAPLPWPVVIRNGRPKGSMPLRSSDLYLSFKRSDTLEILKNGGDLKVFQEDCVTQFYWSLTPIWATELDIDYFRIRWQMNTGEKGTIFKYERNGEVALYWPIFSFKARPNIINLFDMILKYIKMRVSSFVKDLISYSR